MRKRENRNWQRKLDVKIEGTVRDRKVSKWKNINRIKRKERFINWEKHWEIMERNSVSFEIYTQAMEKRCHIWEIDVSLGSADRK